MKKGFCLALIIMFFSIGSVFADSTPENKTSSEPIKIGLMGPMTGPWASEGQEMKDVLDILAADLNASGGLLGRQVKIISEDDGGDPKTASLAAQKLSTQGITAVIGTYGSSITEASQIIYDENDIIQIANGSTAIRLSEKGLNYFFRTCPRDDEQGRVGAQTIKKMGYKNIAILHDNTTYAKGLAGEIKGLIEKEKDMKIVFYDALTPKEQDYSAILTKLKGASPEVVFFTGYYPEAGLLLRQKKEMGWNVPFIGGDATNHPDLVKSAGKEAADGFYFISAPLPRDLPSVEARQFLDAFKKKYNKTPNSIYAVLAGDGFRVVTEAIKGAKSTDPKKVAEYMKTKLKNFPGLTGKLSFNEKGDRVGEVYRLYKAQLEVNFVLQQ